MRPKLVMRKTVCPYCLKTKEQEITLRAAKDKYWWGLPRMTCFDCMVRRAVEGQKRLETKQTPGDHHHDDSEQRGSESGKGIAGEAERFADGGGADEA